MTGQMKHLQPAASQIDLLPVHKRVQRNSRDRRTDTGNTLFYKVMVRRMQPRLGCRFQIIYMIRVSMGQQHRDRLIGKAAGKGIQLRRIHRHVDQGRPLLSQYQIGILGSLTRRIGKAIGIRPVQAVRNTVNAFCQFCEKQLTFQCLHLHCVNFSNFPNGIVKLLRGHTEQGSPELGVVQAFAHGLRVVPVRTGYNLRHITAQNIDRSLICQQPFIGGKG